MSVFMLLDGLRIFFIAAVFYVITHRNGAFIISYNTMTLTDTPKGLSVMLEDTLPENRATSMPNATLAQVTCHPSESKKTRWPFSKRGVSKDKHKHMSDLESCLSSVRITDFTSYEFYSLKIFMNTLRYLQIREYLLDVDLWRLFSNLEELTQISLGFVSSLFDIVKDYVNASETSPLMDFISVLTQFSKIPPGHLGFTQ